MLRWLYSKVIVGSIVLAAATAYSSGFVDTPDACLVLERVNQNDVHLKPVGKCEGKPGRAYLQAAEVGQRVKLYVQGELSGEQTVKTMEIADISGILGRAGKQDLQLPANGHSNEMKKAAQKTADYYNSTEFQAKLERETARIKKEVLGGGNAEYYGETDPVEEAAPGVLGEDERVYLFVSASMPETTLRQYVKDISRIDGRRISLVLRGFIGGMQSITPTSNFFTKILKANPSCDPSRDKCSFRKVDVIIDPLLFKKYDIAQVPAFVYVKGMKLVNPDMSEGKAANLGQSGSSVKLSGDVQLKYVLRRFYEETGAAALESLARGL